MSVVIQKRNHFDNFESKREEQRKLISNKVQKPMSQVNQRFVVKSREDALMETLTGENGFFRNKSNLDRMIPILTGESKISLRILDFFVTNYATRVDIKYEIRRFRNGRPETQWFFVHKSYKSQLNIYSKKLFDPFCRRERHILEYDVNEEGERLGIHTTIGQLNFFKWSIENVIIDYVENHYDEIVKEMNSVDSKQKKSISSRKIVSGHRCSITMSFD